MGICARNCRFARLCPRMIQGFDIWFYLALGATGRRSIRRAVNDAMSVYGFEYICAEPMCPVIAITRLVYGLW